MEADKRTTGKRPKLAEPATTLQPSIAAIQMTRRLCRSINQRSSNQPINKRCHRGFRSAWVHNPRGGSGSGGRGECCSYLSTTLPRLSFRLLPAGMHGVLHQHTCQHSLAPARWEETLMEEKEEKQSKTEKKAQLHSGHQRVW